MDLNKFTVKSQEALQNAQTKAIKYGHQEVDGEHLFLALIEQSEGLVPQLIGHSTLNWALRHISATYVSLITLAEPVGSGVLAYIILNEPVSWFTGAGGVLVLMGIYIASRAEMRRNGGSG